MRRPRSVLEFVRKEERNTLDTTGVVRDTALIRTYNRECQDETKKIQSTTVSVHYFDDQNFEERGVALFAGCFRGLLLPSVMKIPSESFLAVLFNSFKPKRSGHVLTRASGYCNSRLSEVVFLYERGNHDWTVSRVCSCLTVVCVPSQGLLAVFRCRQSRISTIHRRTR